MSTNCIELQSPLTPSERSEIASLASARPNSDALTTMAGLLRSRFGVELATDPDIVAGFTKDSSNLPGSAAGVVRPQSQRECAAIAFTCHVAGVPLTVSAGRSNLTGSATPQGGVVLSTANMLAPAVRVDAAAQTVTAPVGIILEELRNEVLRQSGGQRVFPVDPTSRTDATVGGAIACNASGFTPGEAGAMRHWIEALDVVLPDGRALHARRGQFVSENGRFVLRHAEGEIVLPVPRYPRPAIKNAGGPYSSPDGHMDFVDLVVGSEGLFGLVTACGLRLAHAPAGYLDLFFSLPDEANAVALRDYLAATLDGGVGSLTALEYFGVNCRRHMKHENVLFQGADAVGVYIQAPLAAADADVAAERWLEVLAASGCGVRDDAILTLDNDRDRAIFLEARHSLPASAVETVQRRGTFTIMTDTVVPPPRFPEFLRHTHDLIRSAGMDYLAFGHLGDCHLHFTLLPTQEQLDLGAALYDQIVAKSADLGGVYSGEHGTGRRKRNDFLKCYGAMAVEDVRRCKAALDPRFLLNAGNVIP